MLTAQWLYGLTGCLIVALGLRTALLHKSLLHRLIGINVCLNLVVAYERPVRCLAACEASNPVADDLLLLGAQLIVWGLCRAERHLVRPNQIV